VNKPGVLIVEDEWFVAEEHRTVLEEAGYHVVGPAPSVLRAATLIETELIQAAVLDFGLQGETSAALVPMLQSRKIPFVFASGYAPSDLPEQMRTHRILSKPVAPAVLIKAVRTMLALKDNLRGPNSDAENARLPGAVLNRESD
jgi:DNA-binding NarL/FixJ family response regulator